MLFKPDEVVNLKNGNQIFVEIKEGDVRILKRNYCGVYELYKNDNPERPEYFEDLTLFKNRYGSIHKRFPLNNLSRQRLDIFPVAEYITLRELIKWFKDYGKIIFVKTVELEDIEIDYYNWISDMENTLSSFRILRYGERFTINISIKNKIRAAC